jgi:hypothetical protein
MKEEMADGHATECSSGTLPLAVHVHHVFVFTVIFSFNEKNGEVETKINDITIPSHGSTHPSSRQKTFGGMILR